MFCSNCGEVLEADAKYCNNCGTKTILQEESNENNNKKNRLGVLLIVIILLVVLIVGVGIRKKSDDTLGVNGTEQTEGNPSFAERPEKKNIEISEEILANNSRIEEEIISEAEDIRENNDINVDTDKYVYLRDRFKKMSEVEILELGESQLYKLNAVAGALDVISYHQYTSYSHTDRMNDNVYGLYSDILFYYYEQCSENNILPIDVPQIEFCNEQDPRGYSRYGYYKADEFAYNWIISEVFSLIINPEVPIDEEGNFWYREDDSIYCMVNGLGISYAENVSSEIIGYNSGWYDIIMTIDNDYVYLTATLNELEQYPEQYFWKFMKIHKVEEVAQ